MPSRRLPLLPLLPSPLPFPAGAGCPATSLPPKPIHQALNARPIALQRQLALDHLGPTSDPHPQAILKPLALDPALNPDERGRHAAAADDHLPAPAVARAVFPRQDVVADQGAGAGPAGEAAAQPDAAHGPADFAGGDVGRGQVDGGGGGAEGGEGRSVAEGVGEAVGGGAEAVGVEDGVEGEAAESVACL